MTCREHIDAKIRDSYERLSDGSGPSTLFSMLSYSNRGSPIVIRQANIGNMDEGDIWAARGALYASLFVLLLMGWSNTSAQFIYFNF
jgi:hypothetical protein